MTCSKLKLLLGATSLSFLLSTSCSFAADVAVEPIDVEGGESPSKVAGRKGGAAPASQIDDSLKQAAEKRAQALLALAEADKEEKKAEAGRSSKNRKRRNRGKSNSATTG